MDIARQAEWRFQYRMNKGNGVFFLLFMFVSLRSEHGNYKEIEMKIQRSRKKILWSSVLWIVSRFSQRNLCSFYFNFTSCHHHFYIQLEISIISNRGKITNSIF
jgi:hypothetical protein